MEYRLQTLSPNVLNKDSKKKGAVATLKGPAAVIRHLTPLLQILTGHFLHMGLNTSSVCTSLQKICSKGIQLHGKQWHGKDPEAWANSCWPVHGLGEWKFEARPREQSLAYHALAAHVPAHLWQSIQAQRLLVCWQNCLKEGGRITLAQMLPIVCKGGRAWPTFLPCLWIKLGSLHKALGKCFFCWPRCG